MYRGVVLAGVLGACGTRVAEIDSGSFVIADAGPGDARECEPVGNVACPDNEKCTWIRPDGPTTCSPTGTETLGSPCNVDTDAGTDNCRGRLFCLEGTCREICAVDWDAGLPDFCGDSGPCTRIDAFDDVQNRIEGIDLVGVCPN